MAFNGSASMSKRPRVDVRNDVDNNHKMKADVNHGEEPRRKRPENPENCVLLYTIYNAVYPITTEVIHTISAPSGNVLRIVIFKKTGVQAMVEFDNIDSAKRAKESLNGADIYSGCCTLKIEYAKPTKLNVHKNDTESWDYTLPSGFLAWLVEKSSSEMGKLLTRYKTADEWYSRRLLQEKGKTHRQDRLHFFRNRDSVRDRSLIVRADSSRPHPTAPFTGSGNRYDEFHGGGGGGGGDYSDHFMPERFASPHGDRFKTDFPREGIMSTPGTRTPVFRGMPSAVAPSPGVATSTTTGSVMMVYGLDTKKLNCDRLFNLFCLYGNVARIKFLKTKEGAAMIQMGDGMAVERCVQHLNNAPMFNSKNRLQLGYSKQPFLSDVANPFTLPDGSPSFKDFIGNKHNRFINPAMSMKNRIQSPSRILHFFNTPPNITEEILLGLFVEKKIPSPTTIKIFPLKSERSSSGLLEFEDIEGAIEALVILNHAPIDNPNGKFPYTMKLCFSSSRQVNINGSSRLQNDAPEAAEN